MSWTESATTSFACRHSSAHTADAARVLASLEALRVRLERLFPRTVEDLTVVLHDTPVSLALSNPLMPLLWGFTSPPARRYVTGWVGRRELHVLAPAALRRRASGLPGSFEMLSLAPESLYVRRVILEAQHNVRHSRVPGRGMLELGWAWLIEGAARRFSGESQHSRAAVALRLRRGGHPRFPPRFADAPLLGPTLIELLVDVEGEAAAAAMASRLDPGGSSAALSRAFRGWALGNIEAEWNQRLRQMAGAAGR
jgi:hypothetical protein